MMVSHQAIHSHESLTPTLQVCLRAFACLSLSLPSFGSVPLHRARGKQVALLLHVLGYSMNISGVGLLVWCWRNGLLV